LAQGERQGGEPAGWAEAPTGRPGTAVARDPSPAPARCQGVCGAVFPGVDGRRKPEVTSEGESPNDGPADTRIALGREAG